jgi:DNA-binding transcriptional ArsR family regulator
MLMLNNNGERLKKMALSVLKRHPEGLTIRTLSEIIGVHRQTITKYIFELKGAGIIYRIKIGPATLHYLRKKYPGRLEKSDV